MHGGETRPVASLLLPLLRRLVLPLGEPLRRRPLLLPPGLLRRGRGLLAPPLPEEGQRLPGVAVAALPAVPRGSGVQASLLGWPRPPEGGGAVRRVLLPPPTAPGELPPPPLPHPPVAGALLEAAPRRGTVQSRGQPSSPCRLQRSAGWSQAGGAAAHSWVARGVAYCAPDRSAPPQCPPPPRRPWRGSGWRWWCVRPRPCGGSAGPWGQPATRAPPAFAAQQGPRPT